MDSSVCKVKSNTLTHAAKLEQVSCQPNRSLCRVAESELGKELKKACLSRAKHRQFLLSQPPSLRIGRYIFKRIHHRCKL